MSKGTIGGDFAVSYGGVRIPSSFTAKTRTSTDIIIQKLYEKFVDNAEAIFRNKYEALDAYLKKVEGWVGLDGV